MSAPLNLFPARVAIGVVQPDGSVLMSAEFVRALSVLFERVGGATSLSNSELAAMLASTPTDAAVIDSLRRKVRELEIRLATATDNSARLAKLERQMEALDNLAHAASPAPVDWEHPGKIGYAAPNSASVTTLVASAKTQLNPAGADVELKPTGAGKVIISPAATGTMDNVAIGGTTPSTATFSNVVTTGTVGVGNAANNGTTLSPTVWHRGYSTVPQYRFIVNHVATGMLGLGSDGAGGMILGLSTDSTGAESSRWMTLNGNGAAVASGFGCNGKAPQTAAASGGTLSGVIAALVANGILSS